MSQDPLIARIEKLEKKQRRLHFGISGLSLALLGVLILGATNQGGNSSRQLQVRDSSGKLRASLGVESSGDVVLRLNDAKGNVRSVLGVNRAGQPGLTFYHQKKKPAIELSVANQQPELRLQDAKGKTALTLQAATNAPLLSMSDANASQRVALGAKGKQTIFSLSDASKRKRLSFVARPNGRSFIEMWAANGKPLWPDGTFKQQ